MATKSRKPIRARHPQTDPTAFHKSIPTTDHDAIRRWVEERGGEPATVADAPAGQPEVLRIDFPGSGDGTSKVISWEEFFRKFDENNLAFVYQEETGGNQSRFNKFVARDAETEANTTQQSPSEEF